MRRIILPFATAALTLVGCSLAPTYHRPVEKLPANLGTEAATADNVSLDKWWENFSDATLNKLVEQALARNTDLMQAYGSVGQARAALGMAKADYYPSLSANSSNYRKDTADGMLSAGQKDPGNNFYQYGLLSYEVDLFGRIKSSTRAAREDLFSTEYAAQSMRSLVAANTATTYFNLVAAREQLRITQDSVKTRRNTLKILQDRFDAGYGSDADRQQAIADLASAEVTLPDIQKAIESYQSALRILVGAEADEIWKAAPIDNVPEALPEPPTVSWDVVPASLLERRPDVLAAEAQLKAANDRIGVARAQRWPTLSLSAILGTQDANLDGLFTRSSRTWTVSAAAAAPIYDFGRTSNRIKSAKAAAETAEWNYRAIVRNAFKELRDAATASDLSRQSVEARVRQVDAWKRSYEIALNQSNTGYADPLSILDSQRGQLGAQLSLVSARLDRLVAAVNLSRALGGGWQTQSK
jgi:outer membrane protein, multidrug efflux system